MSKENVQLFLEKVGSDERLKAKVDQLLAEEETIFTENIISLGQSAGYDFNEQSMQSLVTGSIVNTQTEGELDDAELEDVAGGSLIVGSIILGTIIGTGVAVVGGVGIFGTYAAIRIAVEASS